MTYCNLQSTQTMRTSQFAYRHLDRDTRPDRRKSENYGRPVPLRVSSVHERAHVGTHTSHNVRPIRNTARLFGLIRCPAIRTVVHNSSLDGYTSQELAIYMYSASCSRWTNLRSVEATG